VCLQVAGVDERFFTVLAVVRVHPLMILLVLFKCRNGFERFIALLASVRLLPSVHQDVRLQTARLGEGLVALAATV
jgi:hypothetical protein